MWTSRKDLFLFFSSFILIALLCGLLGLAHAYESVWGAAISAGIIFGLLLSLTLGARLHIWTWAVSLLSALLPLATLLWLAERRAFLPALAIALILVGVWYLISEVIGISFITREVVNEVRSLGGEGERGRAIIVHHPGRSGFHTKLQLDLAAGLKAQGWQVAITTASHAAPTDLSAYQLIILGSPTYNLRPAPPMLHYLERLSDLAGKPVVLVLSGEGTTESAMRFFAAQMSKRGGRVVEKLEIWVERPNEERHCINDPHEIMRRAGARLQLSKVG